MSPERDWKIGHLHPIPPCPAPRAANGTRDGAEALGVAAAAAAAAGFAEVAKVSHPLSSPLTK
jgi:hypothetical protein